MNWRVRFSVCLAEFMFSGSYALDEGMGVDIVRMTDSELWIAIEA